jgi:uncharacterized membrane protein
MKNVDSKLLLGLILGAAVGAAIGYLAATGKKDDLLEELNNLAGKVKDGVCAVIGKHKEDSDNTEEAPAESPVKE